MPDTNRTSYTYASVRGREHKEFQKWEVASTEMQTHKRKNYPGSKIKKTSELSPEVLYVNPGIDTIFQNYRSRLKIPAAQRE
jgi:hypothetical protein